MHVCMYLFIYVFMYVCTYECMYVSLCVCKPIYVCIFINLLYVHTRIYIYICTIYYYFFSEMCSKRLTPTMLKTINTKIKLF